MVISGVEQDAIIERLDQIIRQVVPQAITLPKYGGTLYTLKPDEKEGQFCGIFPYQNHVQLAFSNGTALNDPGQVLCGTGKYRRHLNFTNPQDVEPDTLSALIDAAAAYSLNQSASG